MKQFKKHKPQTYILKYGRVTENQKLTQTPVKSK